MELPSLVVQFAVQFPIGAHRHDLNRLLFHLELGDVECDINHLIYPVMWPVAHHQDPPFEELPQLLVPWDEDLVASHNIHFFVAHDPIFDAVESLAHALHGQIDMVTAAIPLVDREHTTLFVHRIPHLRILELLSNQILRGQQLEARVQDLEDVVRHLRQHLGI